MELTVAFGTNSHSFETLDVLLSICLIHYGTLRNTLSSDYPKQISAQGEAAELIYECWDWRWLLLLPSKESNWLDGRVALGTLTTCAVWYQRGDTIAVGAQNWIWLSSVFLQVSRQPKYFPAPESIYISVVPYLSDSSMIWVVWRVPWICSKQMP